MERDTGMPVREADKGDSEARIIGECRGVGGRAQKETKSEM